MQNFTPGLYTAFVFVSKVDQGRGRDQHEFILKLG